MRREEIASFIDQLSVDEKIAAMKYILQQIETMLIDIREAEYKKANEGG